MPLGMDHVGNGYKRKVQAIRLTRSLVYRRGTSRTFAASNNVRTDHKIPVRIKGLSRPDHIIPPAFIVLATVNARCMGISGKGVQSQYRVRLLLVQLSVGFISDGDRSQFLPAFKFMFPARSGIGIVLR